MDVDLEWRVARLQPGDHLCLIYRSAAEQTAALISFFKAGLNAGERCFFVGPTPSARRLERGLESAGVAVETERARGALVLVTRREDWLTAGRYDPGSLLEALRQEEQQAVDDGFSGLRASWNLDWVLEGTPDAGRLLEYEAYLNRFLPGSRVCALCRYGRESVAAGRIQGALHTHPLVVLGHQICHNAYYEPPGMVLGDSSPDERIDWMLAKLQQSRLSEQKLEDVSLRLAQKRAALARADRAKGELLSMLAHELRNPLGTISNALEVLRLKGEGDETWRRALEAAERQVHHQALLIDDLLEASRVTRRQIELECKELDLIQLVNEAVESYRETLDEAGLTLKLDLPAEKLPVRGDRLRLSQILSNLLQNAMQFTPRGGCIAVRAALLPGGRRIELTVSDNGAGIAPEELPYLFEVFSQADHQSLDRSRGGLGVGLAVVKALVEMHGGEVEAHSEGPGKGAELAIRLPVAIGEPEIEDAEERAASTGARRILVVEDNADAALTMRDFLELSGHEVHLATSGVDGVREARNFHPEIVLCDIGLPGMDGFEVAEALRRDPTTRKAKLIAVTGYGADEDRRRSKEAGFDLHLTKPVDPAKLRAVLR
ncbi:MAG TPA: MEDS domain-containing protein [Thermoanaerobaculia bacterium]|nr:MEDS domain-containing protein [Thermoanaerobaculia bacterium]